MKKYILAFLLVLISSSILWGSSKESWVKYNWGESGVVFLPESFKVEIKDKAVFRYGTSLPQVLGVLPEIKGQWKASITDLVIDQFSISSKRLKTLSLEDAEQICQYLNENDGSNLNREFKEFQLLKKSFFKNKNGVFSSIMYTASFRDETAEWRRGTVLQVRYLITLHQNKNRENNVAVLRFFYWSSSQFLDDNGHQSEHQALLLSNAIASKWEVTPPGPYIETPLIAVAIIGAYLIAGLSLMLRGFYLSIGNRGGAYSSVAYPHWLWHLKTFKGRLAYCPIFLLPLLFGAERYLFPSEFLSVSVVAFVMGIIVLSVLHLIAKEWKPWRKREKPFRVTIFMMGLWVVVVFAFALVVGPARFDPEETEESSVIVANILLWSLAPAALGGAVSYIYQKHIK